MPAGARASPRVGRRCRCSTSITRSGSASSSAISTTPTARITAQLAYWEQTLDGIPEQLDLPTDRPYPPVADQRGATVAVEWPAELQQQVRELAREHNATTLHGDAGRPRRGVGQGQRQQRCGGGLPDRRAPRPRRWTSLVGFFVNTLVLRADLTGDPTVAELLAQVRSRSLAAYEHQDVPFEVLVERLNPTRRLTHHPLVQVMLSWQNLAGQGAQHWFELRRRTGHCAARPTPTPPAWI